MLGEISDGIADLAEEEDERRQRMLVECVSTANGYFRDCTSPSCEDPARFCDGTFNYPYVGEFSSIEAHYS